MEYIYKKLCTKFLAVDPKYLNRRFEYDAMINIEDIVDNIKVYEITGDESVNINMINPGTVKFGLSEYEPAFLIKDRFYYIDEEYIADLFNLFLGKFTECAETIMGNDFEQYAWMKNIYVTMFEIIVDELYR